MARVYVTGVSTLRSYCPLQDNGEGGWKGNDGKGDMLPGDYLGQRAHVVVCSVVWYTLS